MRSLDRHVGVGRRPTSRRCRGGTRRQAARAVASRPAGSPTDQSSNICASARPARRLIGVRAGFSAGVDRVVGCLEVVGLVLLPRHGRSWARPVAGCCSPACGSAAADIAPASSGASFCGPAPGSSPRSSARRSSSEVCPVASAASRHQRLVCRAAPRKRSAPACELLPCVPPQSAAEPR